MIITTSGQIEGYKIVQYRELVFGDVISGTNMFKDIAASFRDIVGGRSNAYEKVLTKSRNEAIGIAISSAANMGANAIIGAHFDYETVGTGMIMTIFSGTAVYIEPIN